MWVLVVGLATMASAVRAEPVGYAFTYQGNIEKSGGPVTGVCDFQFNLYDALTGGFQVGTQSISGVTVTEGLFSAEIDFGFGRFGPQARFLETLVKCPPDGSFTMLSPRVELTPTPNATYCSTADEAAHAANADTLGLAGFYPSDFVLSAPPVIIQNGGDIVTLAGGSTAIEATSSAGLGCECAGLIGIRATAIPSPGIAGFFQGDVVVNAGLEVVDEIYAYYHVNVAGDVSVRGNIFADGSIFAGGFKPFRIDHPFDPTNQYLYHYALESPEVLNMYRGNAVLDSDGQAWVDLPNYFAAINKDFHYQLTCVGGFAPVYIGQKIADNRFQIAGGTPGLEVSWTVTAQRNDRYAQRHGAPVEQEKPAEYRGTYVQPELWGQPKEMQERYRERPDLAKQAETSKRQNVETSKLQNVETLKRQNVETSKQGGRDAGGGR